MLQASHAATKASVVLRMFVARREDILICLGRVRVGVIDGLCWGFYYLCIDQRKENGCTSLTVIFSRGRLSMGMSHAAGKS